MAGPQKVSGKDRLDSFPGRSFDLLVDGYYRALGPPKSHNAQPGGVSPILAVTVKNDSGADVEPGNVLGIDGLIFTSDDRASAFYDMPAFSCITPTVSDHADSFVVIRQGIKAGEVMHGGGVLAGAANVYIDVTDAGHEFAVVTNSTPGYMTSASSGGRRIIWKEAGTGVKKATVLLLARPGEETLRLIRGQVVGDIAASATTFTIDNVLELASGLSPGASITVNNTQAEAFEDNTWVTCIYSPTVSSDWEVLRVERFRAIQGLATAAVLSSAATFTIDNVVGLDHGVDPTAAVAATTVTIQNVHSESYADNAVVVADYCASANTWRARAKPAQKLRKAIVYSDIAAATMSGSDIDPGTGVVKLYTRAATAGNNWVFVDAGVTAWNLEPSPFATGVKVWIDEEGYVVGGVGSAAAILVKITGTISARSGTTLGSGTAQPVSPDNLATNVGGTLTVYNMVTRALSGATETVYCRAIQLEGSTKYFIDPLDPIWFMNYSGITDGTVFGLDGSSISSNLVFRQGLEDVQVDAASFQLEKKVFGGAFVDYHTGGEC